MERLMKLLAINTLAAVLIGQQGLPGSVAAADFANWPQWRGASASGSTTNGSYPVKWDATNVLWRAPLPGKGCSTPIVWEKRIILTAPVEGLDAALAFDWAGKPLWRRTFGTGTTGKHQNASGCNPSPATDGQGVFVYFKSGTLAALGLDGQLRWETNLVTEFGPLHLYWDQGTSPVLTEKYVVVARMHHGESWLAAFDKVSGKLCWKVPRNYETPVEGDESYSTPVVIRREGRESVLVWGAEHVTFHDGRDGQVIWSCSGFNPRAMAHWPSVASPLVAADMALIPAGRADRGQPYLYGLKLGGRGDVTATHRTWKREDVGTYVPTPAEYKNLVYLLRDDGEVECLNPATGQTVWRGAFAKASAKFYASPVIAGGKLYAAREDGVIFVAQVEREFQLLAENAMDDRIIASPVPVANRLLIRAEKHLFCVGAE
jgi:outer membrane protein assembly factor BamB